MAREDPSSKLTEALTRFSPNPGTMTQVKSKEQNTFYLGNLLSAKRFGLQCFKDLVNEDEILRQADTGDLNRSQQIRDALCARREEELHMMGLHGRTIDKLEEKNK